MSKLRNIVRIGTRFEYICTELYTPSTGVIAASLKEPASVYDILREMCHVKLISRTQVGNIATFKVTRSFLELRDAILVVSDFNKKLKREIHEWN